jgi:hypothetical protein
MAVKKQITISSVDLDSLILEGEIKVVDIDSLREWKDNPKTEEQIQGKVGRLKKILKSNGQVSPVVAWTKNNVIYKGNTTRRAMKELGSKKIKVLYVPFPSEEIASVYGIADTQSSIGVGVDPILLARLMKGDLILKLDVNENDLQIMTGLSSKEYKSMMLGSEHPEDLPNVDLQGIIPGKSDFMVVQFTSKDEMNELKSILGLTTEHQRVIPYELLKKFMIIGNTKRISITNDNKSDTKGKRRFV